MDTSSTVSRSGSNPAGSRYDQLSLGRRAHYLDRARECARVTLPYLYPPGGHTFSHTLPTPYNSVGARGVTNLAAKLLLALLPPSISFFRFNLDRKVVEELEATQPDSLPVLRRALAGVESDIMQYLESINTRSAIHEALLHLLVSGNVLLYKPVKRDLWKVYSLERYVVVRDPSGRWLEIITCEQVHRSSIPLELHDQLDIDPADHGDSDGDWVKVYTHVVLNDDGKSYSQWQEVNGHVVPGTKVEYTKENCPWFPLRMNKVDGEAYGRSYVEQFLGDLHSLELLSHSVVMSAAVASKVIFLTAPGSITKPRDLNRVESGEFVTGREGDIVALQVDKSADMSTAMALIQQMEQRMGHAFLLFDAVQRDAERVTSEEIRVLVQELENAQGGMYSILSQELQLPMVRLLMNEQEFKLPSDLVTPTITTGLDALGRTSDLQRLDEYVTRVTQVLGPETAMKLLKPLEYSNRVAMALNIDTAGLVATEEELAEAQQQEQMMMMAQQLGPDVIQAGAKMATSPNNPPTQ